MRIEVLPVLIGIVAVAIGLALIADAVIPDGTFISVERRRGDRAPRNQIGEGLLGAAIVALGAALIGRDSWPYTTLSVLLAVLLGAAGVAMNWRYLHAMAVAPQRRSGETTPSAIAEADAEPEKTPSGEKSPASLR